MLENHRSTLPVVLVALYLWRKLQRYLRARRIDQHFLVDYATTQKKFTVVSKHSQNITLEEIPTLVAEMKECYASGISKPIEFRLAQLKALLQLFEENEEAIVEAIRKDLGRPKFESLYYDNILPISEIKACIRNLYNWVCPESAPFSLLTFPSTDEIYKEPLGTVCVIGTWNYPWMLCMVPVAGAIAAGNNVILKPCMVSPHSARLIADLCAKYLDPRVVQVVGTKFTSDRQCTHALLEHPFDHVFFTGSPSVGRVIMQMAAKHLTPCTLELGGKNPVFVDRDADLEIAAQRVVWGRMMNAGQQCIAPDYVLCHRDVVDKFAAKCGQWAEKMYGKDPQKAGTIGRIVGKKQMDRLVGVLKNHGGRVIHGGKFDENDKYISPTVVVVDRESPAMAEETFGPILLITSISSVDDGIKYVNQRPKPLSLYLFTSSDKTAERIIYNTSAGGVTVNATLFHVGHSELPFGGIQESGMGVYHSHHTFECFSHKKPVLRKSMWKDGGLLSNPFFLYPPFTDLKIKILRVVGKLL